MAVLLFLLIALPGWGQEGSPPAENGSASAEAAAAPAGDPLRGESLFIGSSSFANGGAPCLACHGIAGHGLAGGASFGADLSAVHQDYGSEDLLSLLEDMPFPSMEPIYAERPLTPEERADLTAFLAEVSGQTPPVAGAFVLKGSLGAAVLMAVILAFGWRRLTGVRGELVEEVRRRSANG